MTQRHTLAIETSCDDTSVAVVRQDGLVLACQSAHQDALHQIFGGVVPEIASRSHTEVLLPLLDYTLQLSGLNWSQIDVISVTSRPGLMGSLIVGVVTAKTLALAKQKSLIGVNHLEAHLLAPFLHDDEHALQNIEFPFLALAVSGAPG
jgi:N6-L-threonylcarbamoyladenine synthase